MTNDVLPMEELASRIEQQEAELAKLREEFKARESQMGELTRRREELLAEIQKIDEKLGKGPAPKATASPPAQKAPAPAPAPAKTKPTPTSKPEGKVSFSQFLYDCVKAAGRPISGKELTDEVTRQNFPTNSKNLRGMVDTRIGDLIRKKFLKRSKDGSGVIINEKASVGSAKPAKAAAPAAPKPEPTAKAAPAKKPGRPALAKSEAKPAETEKKESLFDVIVRVFTKNARPLSIREITEKVLAQGYATESTNFQKVVAVRLANMDNVERVDDHTYAMKKAKGKKA